MYGIAGSPGTFPSYASPSAKFIKPVANVVIERMLQPWY